MPLSREALEKEATSFRAAVEEYLRRNPDVRLTTDFLNPFRGNFPTDACKATSVMLGHYLTRQVDADELRYVWGWREDVSHGWLEHNGYILDLTADQFPEVRSSVIVETAVASEWHQGFKPWRVHPFEFRKDHILFRRSQAIASLLDQQDS